MVGRALFLSNPHWLNAVERRARISAYMIHARTVVYIVFWRSWCLSRDILVFVIGTGDEYDSDAPMSDYPKQTARMTADKPWAEMCKGICPVPYFISFSS